MAANAWKIYGKAKRHIGRGEITLHTGVFKMSLHRNSASTTIKVLSTRDVFSSVGAQISATGGYAAGGRSVPGFSWTIGASANQLKCSYTAAGVIFTGSGAALNNIRFALIRKSAGSTTSGNVICFCSLSTANFTIASGNTLTILPNASGVFTLA